MSRARRRKDVSSKRVRCSSEVANAGEMRTEVLLEAVIGRRSRWTRWNGSGRSLVDSLWSEDRVGPLNTPIPLARFSRIDCGKEHLNASIQHVRLCLHSPMAAV